MGFVRSCHVTKEPTMITPSRRLAPAILAGGLALGAAACGTTAAPASSTSPSTPASAPATDAGVDPNAPEVNPPGDIPDDQVFVEHVDDTGGFTVKVPEGWARSEVGGTTIFTDKLNSVAMTSVDASTAPTVATARADEVPMIESTEPNVAIQDVTEVQRGGQTAVLITYLRDGTADPVTGKTVREAVERYEFHKDGTEGILTLSGPDGADNVDPWKLVSESFTWM